MTLSAERPKHSTLGASSAYRWMACPGSVRASVGAENTQSIYAAEGSAAHAVGDRALKDGRKTAFNYVGDTIEIGEHAFEVDDEMAEAVDVYVSAVRAAIEEGGPGSIVLLEHGFTLHLLDPRFYGTNDAIVYQRKFKRLKVFDYKHGAGVPVFPEENKQLKYYGLGALMVLDVPIDEIELIIVQPRADAEHPVKSWTTNFEALWAYGAELVAAAAKTDVPGAELVTGDHCRFCPVLATCPKVRDEAFETAGAHFDDDGGDMVFDDVDTLGENRIAILMERAGRIEDWVKAVRARAHLLATEGRGPAGYKLVDKRARRKWKYDAPDLILRLHQIGISTEHIYVGKLKSPAMMEKDIGKAKFREFEAELVESVSSGTVLVPIEDPRPAVQASRNPESMFDD